MATDMNSAGMAYPLTKMNFLVSIPDRLQRGKRH